MGPLALVGEVVALGRDIVRCIPPPLPAEERIRRRLAHEAAVERERERRHEVRMARATRH